MTSKGVRRVASSGGHARSAPARVLVVDDEPELRTAVCRILEAEGYAPQAAPDGPQALRLLQDSLRQGEPFELLMADLVMPDMDGIALLRAARESDEWLVGIIMTGHGTIDSAVAAMKDGALDYVLKPFKLEVLKAVLARARDVRRLRLQN